MTGGEIFGWLFLAWLCYNWGPSPAKLLSVMNENSGKHVDIIWRKADPPPL